MSNLGSKAISLCNLFQLHLPPPPPLLSFCTPPPPPPLPLTNRPVPYTFQLKRDQYAFFPLNRALCLASLDDEAAESKLDTVAEDVSFLVRQHHDGVRALCFFYYPPKVSTMKYCCLEVFRKEYFRLVTK